MKVLRSDYQYMRYKKVPLYLIFQWFAKRYLRAFIWLGLGLKRHCLMGRERMLDNWKLELMGIQIPFSERVCLGHQRYYNVLADGSNKETKGSEDDGR